MAAFIELNPSLDVDALAASYSAAGRLQIGDVLTEASAEAIYAVLAARTPWGLAWQAGDDGPHLIRAETLAAMPAAEIAAITGKLQAAVRTKAYSFAYHSYPLVTAYLEQWTPGSPHERLLEELNAPPFLDLLRRVTGAATIRKADGQATLYAPGHYLSLHDDDEPERGRVVAYVFYVTREEWRPEWGGQLRFLSAGGDEEEAFRPRFNSLSLFRVPQLHDVSQVAAGAPIGRYAITGWGRDR